jgi:hypothetical protein
MSITASGTKSVQLQRYKMPYRSIKQERYFNVNKKKLEAQGVDVNEWNQSSKGMKLPERVGKRILRKRK